MGTNELEPVNPHVQLIRLNILVKQYEVSLLFQTVFELEYHDNVVNLEETLLTVW